AGDAIVVSGSRASTEVTVAGIYRDLLEQPRTPFWASLDTFIYTSPGADTRPPALMLMNLETYAALEDRLLDDQDPVTWEFLLPAEPTPIEDAERLVAHLNRFRATLSDTALPLRASFRSVNYNEPLSGWVTQAKEVVRSISGPIRALALATQAVALAVLGGAGLFMVRRRRTEFAVLESRGVSNLWLGTRTAIETLVPVALGAAVGWALTLVAVRWIGPGAVLGDRAVSHSAVTVGWTALLAVVLFGVVAAASVGAQLIASAGSARRLVARTPWEPFVLILAALAFYGLRAGSTSPGAEGTLTELDPLFLLFPILLLAGVAGLATRGLRWLLPRLRGWGSRRQPSLFLASRRLAAAPRLATSLIVASAVAVGILVYAGTVTSSIKETATQAAALAVGSDVSAHYTGPRPDVATADFPATSVVRIAGASFTSNPALDLDVLLVDPTTFESTAFWRSEFADRSLEDLMDAIVASGEGRLPVVVAGPIRPPSDAILSVPGSNVPVHVAARARTFPGIVGNRPITVMSREALTAMIRASGLSLAQLADGYEIWGRAGEDEVRSFVSSTGATVGTLTSAAELRDTQRYLAVTSMLRFLLSVGILAGTVVLIGALLYLQTRQRQAEASYALMRRMGLSRSAHRRSVAVEIAGLLFGASLIGAIVAVVASVLVFGDIQAKVLDARVTLFRLPLPLLAWSTLILGVFAWTAATLAQRQADVADVAEVMRLAE
ncbi:MAG: hypothetical protein ACXWW5_08700, partial [Actinomycetota bacterium]